MIFSKRAGDSAKRYSEYNDSPKWTLLDNFNILEEQRPNGSRAFVRKCLPRRLHVTLTSAQVVNALDWQQQRGSKGAEAPRGYANRPRISFNGALEDRITVFSMEKGAIETFSEFKDGSIYPSDEEIGGTGNATFADGIHNSGGHAPKVPPGGLMEGEPGIINHFPEEHSLLLSLPLDEASFEKLAQSVRQAASVHLTLLCELFEGEVSAAFKDPSVGVWSEYGLLLSEDKHYARARIDSITVFDAERPLVEHVSRPRDDLEDLDDAPVPLERQIASLHRRLGHVLWALIAIVALLLLIAF